MLYSPTIWRNSWLIGLGHCAASTSIACASDKPGPNGVGQHHHRVGQLVFDLLPPPLGHPPQQIPRPAKQQGRNQDGEDRASEQEPEYDEDCSR